jgi:hypothetical protein
MEASKVLRGAAAKVLHGHAKGVPARDAMGEPCALRSEAAVAFCAIGSINLIADGARVSSDAMEALRHLITAETGARCVSLADWSDASDGPTVAAAMLRAAETLEATDA